MEEKEGQETPIVRTHEMTKIIKQQEIMEKCDALFIYLFSFQGGTRSITPSIMAGKSIWI